jgi:hypothetical protein
VTLTLKRILKKGIVVVVVDWIVWLRNRVVVVNALMHLQAYKTRGIFFFFPTERLPASKEGLCCMEL